MQLFSLGIVGEYVGRIYARLNNAPQFIVSKKTF
jgi:undecaprenyl-phosphate 4-deoxy-4-formamido-L-arabinose transferase